MARITASVYTSHVPAIGAALDLGKSGEDYWKRFSPATISASSGSRNKSRMSSSSSITTMQAFSLDLIPTFALGTGASFTPADEGWGPRPVPVVHGHPELAAHIAQSVIQDDFDLTLVNKWRSITG